MALIKRKGWTLVEEYVDNGVSAYARKVKRPAYDRLEADYEAGRFDVIVCWDFDRLTRQPRQLERWIDLGSQRGLVILTPTEETDLGTDNGRMFARIKSAVAASEVERKSARQKAENAQRIGSGKPRAGVRPFGWEKDGTTLRESEAVYIRQAHRAVLEGKSLHSIAAEFNAAGVLTSRGYKWQTITVRKMLARKRNAGLLESHGTVQEESHIEPAVSRDEHDAVLALLSDPSRNLNKGSNKRVSYLSGIPVCAVCGSVMRSKRLTMKGGRQRFYICETRLDGSLKDGQAHVSIRADSLEAEVPLQVYMALRHRLENPPAGAEDTHRNLVELQNAAAEVRRQKGVVQELALLPGADVAHAGRQLLSLQEQLEGLNNRIAELTAEAAHGGLLDGLMDEFSAEQFNEFAAKFNDLDDDRKRTLVDGLLSITVAKGYGTKRVEWVTR